MRIAVVGLGSMGKRRIRLIRNHFVNFEVIGIDSRADRREEAQETFAIVSFESLEKAASQQLDAVFICTSPVTHEAIIKAALELNLHVFTEINLLNSYYEDVIKIAKNKNLHLYLSSTFLHRKEINYIKEKVNLDKKITYRYHVGQYLPDWHPWESYKNFFVANKKTNGTREIFAIELPWLVTTFGDIKKISVVSNKISDLEIDYPDNYSVLIEHETGILGTMNVNIVSRIAKRDLDIIGENTQIEWDGTPMSLREWSHENNEMIEVKLYDEFEKDPKYAANIIEDAYLEEIIEFVRLVNGEISETVYSFEKDKEIIDWIDLIEK